MPQNDCDPNPSMEKLDTRDAQQADQQPGRAWNLDQKSRDILLAALLHDQLLKHTETFVVASVALPATVTPLPVKYGH